MFVFEQSSSELQETRPVVVEYVVWYVVGVSPFLACVGTVDPVADVACVGALVGAVAG